MSTPNFENFSQKAFIKEIHTFMKKNHISTRAWAKMTKSSLATLQRLESGESDITIKTAIKFQKAIRIFKPDA